MPATSYNLYQVQLHQLSGWPNGAAAGGTGKFIVTTAGTADRATIYDADTLTQNTGVVTANNGRISFATLSTVDSVDIYGFTGDGAFIVRRGLTIGVHEIFYNNVEVFQTAVIPVHYSDFAIAAEADTGLDLPVGALVLPEVAVHVKTADATETLDVGLLSTESGGDADGFLVQVSVGTAGVVPGLLVGTDTLGALLKEDTNGSSVLVRKPHVISTATSVVVNMSSGTDSFEGFVYIPYMRKVT